MVLRSENGVGRPFSRGKCQDEKCTKRGKVFAGNGVPVKAAAKVDQKEPGSAGPSPWADVGDGSHLHGSCSLAEPLLIAPVPDLRGAWF